MKLNKEKFMKTEMGGELEETIRTWDKAIDERKKATPGIGNPDQGLGLEYWENTCRSCQDRWEVFKLAIKQFYGIEFFFTRTDETSMLKRRIRADKRLREELSRNNAETREMIHETYQEIAEQLEIEGDWDEVYVQDQFNDDYEIRDVIEAFYDCMIEKVLNYIGAE